jgi:hypothetical protein
LDTTFRPGNLGRNGYHFQKLDRRHQGRFWTLVSEHAHAVNALVSGLSALPGVVQPLAAAQAMTRFLNRDDIPLHALIEPAQDAVRAALAGSPGRFALVVHDGCMLNFRRHPSQGDRHRRSHEADLGYELGSALVLDAAGAVLARWWPLSNVPAADADTATIGRWYAWRGRIEVDHKRLKSNRAG